MVTDRPGPRDRHRVDGAGNRRRVSAKEQVRLLAAQRARRRRLGVAAGAVALVLGAVVAMAVIRVVTDGDGGGSADVPDPVTAVGVVDTATSVPVSVLDAVGKGRTMAGPRRVDGQPALSEDGKPLILYVGAEYCPFCASQRWAVVVALSRFGSFSGLRLTHSASDDVYPDTQTVTFHGAGYTSQYLSFQGVELATNERDGNRYAPLDEMTDRQRQVVETLNAAPYVPEESAGAIPFMDFANKQIVLGGTYDAELLQGKSATEIAAALHTPEDPIAQGILGTANMFTTVLCQLTDGKPGQVCDGAAATAYRGVV